MERTYNTICDYFAEVDFDWLKDYEILGVELKQNFTLGKNNFIGFIDLLLRDKRDGKIIVVDHKSTEYPFKQNGEVKKKMLKSFNTYRKQMYLYCRAVYQTFGEFPKAMTWNHFKENRFATIPFIKSEYEEIMKWFEKTIEAAEKEEAFEPTKEFFIALFFATSVEVANMYSPEVNNDSNKLCALSHSYNAE